MQTDVNTPTSHRTVAAGSLAVLLEGNARFAQGKPRPHPLTAERRAELLDGQYPIATVLGCVDARVPPELIFDQGVGDLLTVRSAGEALTGVALGSVEFGVRSLGVPLLIVLGHIGCGAVAAALLDAHPGGYLEDLTDEVAQRLTQLVKGDPVAATTCNTQATVDALRKHATLRLPDGEPAIVVGVLYDMATGEVAVIDDDGLDVGLSG